MRFLLLVSLALALGCQTIHSRSEFVADLPADAQYQSRRMSCGPRTVCWFLEAIHQMSCDLSGTYDRIWDSRGGSHIFWIAAEVGLATGLNYAAVRLEPRWQECLSSCSPVIALVDGGAVRSIGHFIVILSTSETTVTWFDINRGYFRSGWPVFLEAWRPYDFAAVIDIDCVSRCSKSAIKRREP